MMANRPDAVAGVIPEERGIVGRMIVAHAWRTVVGAASGNAGAPERVYLRLPLRLEAPMSADGLLRPDALADGEIDTARILGSCPLAITEPVVATADLDDVERLHDRIIE